jgi:hypothetical protein
MDDGLRAELQALADEADELADEVEAAFDEHATFTSKRATRQKVDGLQQRWFDAMAALTDEKDRFQVERTWGRKVIDLVRMAARLPAAAEGMPAEKLADNSFFGTRAPKSSRGPVVPGLQPGEELRRDSDKVRVTGEIEAWCGRCAMVRSQTVAAVVEDKPAQVVCQVCGSRSRYREGPARSKKPAATVSRSASASATHQQRESENRQREKNELLELLHGAENPRVYDPKERYKAGEIIEHPEHGRGRIENTLPRSLLVRFAGGLKPLKLG